MADWRRKRNRSLFIRYFWCSYSFWKARFFSILKRKTRVSSSSSESGALTPKEKRIYEPSFEADDEVHIGLDMAEDLGSKLQLVLQKLNSLESMVERVLQRFNDLESSVNGIKGEFAPLSAKTDDFEKAVLPNWNTGAEKKIVATPEACEGRRQGNFFRQERTWQGYHWWTCAYSKLLVFFFAFFPQHHDHYCACFFFLVINSGSGSVTFSWNANMPKALNPMGCVYDLAISSSYNNLLFIVLCLSVKNDPFVFRSYFVSLKLVTFSSHFAPYGPNLTYNLCTEILLRFILSLPFRSEKHGSQSYVVLSCICRRVCV